MEAGADGYLLKDADGDFLVQALQAVQRGDIPLHPGVTSYLVKKVSGHYEFDNIMDLTDREGEVLQLAAKGYSNKVIAKTLSISEGTAKVHMSNILSKLKAGSRTEAVVLAVQRGLISVGDYI